MVGFVLASCILFPFLGQDFFLPSMPPLRHARADGGDGSKRFGATVDEIEQMIAIIPADQLGEIIDNLGLPSGINTAQQHRHRQPRGRRYPCLLERRACPDERLCSKD